MRPRGRLRFVFAGVSMVEVFFTCGVLFGWPSLEIILRSEHVYENDNQSLRLASIFTVASSALGFLSLPTGMLLDRLGPRVMHVFGSLAFTIGCLILSFSSTDVDGYMPGTIFLAVANCVMYLQFFHVSNLFPTHAAVYLMSISALFDSSVVVFWTFETLYTTYSIPLQFMFAFLTGLGCVFCLLSAIWPKRPYEQDALAMTPLEEDSPKDAVRPRVYSATLQSMCTMNQIKSLEFLVMGAFGGVSLLRLNFYFSAMAANLALVYGEEQGTTLTSAFGIIIPFGAIAAPFLGLVNSKFGFNSTFVIVIAVGCVWEAFVVVQSAWAQYLSFVFFGIFRGTLYAAYFAAIPGIFGYAHIGTITGSLYTILAMFNLLAYPVNAIALSCCGGHTQIVDFVFLACGGATFLVPLFFRRRQHYWAKTDSSTANVGFDSEDSPAHTEDSPL